MQLYERMVSGITVVVLCNMGWKAELFLQVTSLCTTTGVCVGKIGGGGGGGGEKAQGWES